jgi:hypothetical protein
MMVLSSTTILLCLLVILASYLVVNWYFKVDDRLEEIRKAAARAGAFFSRLGFEYLPEFFVCGAAGDKSGFVNKLLEFEKTFLGHPELLKAHMQKVCLIMTVELMDDDMEFVEALAAKVNAKKFIEEKEREAEREVESARLIVEKQKFDAEFAKRQAEIAAANAKPAA